jgi:hypothetical protein
VKYVVPKPEGVDSSDDLLAQVGIDPEHFEATNVWKKTQDYSIHFRPKGMAGAEPLSAERIEEILSHYPAPNHSLPFDGSVFYVAIADAQIGKPDGGGTPSTIRRVKKALQDTCYRIATETVSGRVDTIIVGNLGDSIEGAVSQGGRLAQDCGVAQQIEIAQSLLFEAVCALAPLCDRLVVGTVPSNHGETRRDRNTASLDNFDVTIAKAAEMAVGGRPGYEHVEFAYPDEDEVYVVIRHIYGSIGLAHGHVGASNPDRFRDQYVKSARSSAQHPLSSCRVISSGHFHHARWEDTGLGWDWVQAPALESGSNWFRQAFSKDSKKGILTGYLTPEGFERGQIHQGIQEA